MNLYASCGLPIEANPYARENPKAQGFYSIYTDAWAMSWEQLEKLSKVFQILCVDVDVTGGYKMKLLVRIR